MERIRLSADSGGRRNKKILKNMRGGDGGDVKCPCNER